MFSVSNDAPSSVAGVTRITARSSSPISAAPNGATGARGPPASRPEGCAVNCECPHQHLPTPEAASRSPTFRPFVPRPRTCTRRPWAPSRRNSCRAGRSRSRRGSSRPAMSRVMLQPPNTGFEAGSTRRCHRATFSSGEWPCSTKPSALIEELRGGSRPEWCPCWGRCTGSRLRAVSLSSPWAAGGVARRGTGELDGAL